MTDDGSRKQRSPAQRWYFGYLARVPISEAELRWTRGSPIVAKA
jgi:hypothetical protein